MKWFEEMKDLYLSGLTNRFVLKGNIDDYQKQSLWLEEALAEEAGELGIQRTIAYEAVSRGEYMEYCDAGGKTVREDAREIGKGFIKYQSFSAGHFGSTCGESEPTLFVFLEPEQIFPGDADQETIGIVRNMMARADNTNLFVFVTANKERVNSWLMQGRVDFFDIEVPYPAFEERLRMFEYLKSRLHEDLSGNDGTDNMEELMLYLQEQPKDYLEMLARLSAGLNCHQIEDVWLSAESRGMLEVEFISDRKRKVIQSQFGDVLDICDGNNKSLDSFMGSDHLKRYFREVVVESIRNGETSIVPKGFLFTGPPGTGKTYFAKLLAGESSMSFVELKMSKLLDKYVGNSEKKFEKALSCIKSMAPTFVFIDEMDQAFRRGDQDSNSVSSNLFGMLLPVLSDPESRGKVVWIGATNYPNKIDEALKRAGRFDKKVPFLSPNEEDCKKLIIHYFQTMGNNDGKRISQEDLKDLSEKLSGYTQAEIENVFVKAYELAVRENRGAGANVRMEVETVLKAADYVVRAGNSKIDEMEKLAIKECNDKEFIDR